MHFTNLVSEVRHEFIQYNSIYMKYEVEKTNL